MSISVRIMISPRYMTTSSGKLGLLAFAEDTGVRRGRWVNSNEPDLEWASRTYVLNPKFLGDAFELRGCSPTVRLRLSQNRGATRLAKRVRTGIYHGVFDVSVHLGYTRLRRKGTTG